MVFGCGFYDPGRNVAAEVNFCEVGCVAATVAVGVEFPRGDVESASNAAFDFGTEFGVDMVADYDCYCAISSLMHV